jgi:hypothetical protein
MKPLISPIQFILIFLFTASSVILFSQKEMNEERILLLPQNDKSTSESINDDEDSESEVLKLIKAYFSKFNDFELQRLKLISQNPNSKEMVDLLDKSIDEFAISKGFSLVSITSTGTYRDFSEHQIKSYKYVEEREKIGVRKSNNR